MRRREFISLIGGVVISLPIAARAQSESRMRRIGVLMPFTATDPEEKERNAVFERRWDHDLGVWEIERSRLGADTVDVIAVESGSHPLPYKRLPVALAASADAHIVSAFGP